ncbi:hypothetical protein QYM36_000253 [Artemia franciscana]|uniref:RRM domain-containing protein n=1 Tax=Artemia franciscana TaxID=6661 RepID=A0AA88IBX1_ARTSF|nr:hypothetical protein QYM36_000253 [Artemia franciscana]
MFKATENEVKKYFSQFGKVLDVNLLKKDDGRLKGCCFIQFEKTMEANKALMNANAKEFKGRLIAVDWALPKARYLEGKAENTEDTTEAANDTTEITSEDRLNNLNSNASDESDSAIESCNDSQENDADTALEEEDENDDNFDDNPDDDDDDSEGERRWEGEKHKQAHQPSDVQEGKTVFLSNLPLDIEEDALKQEMESFGKVIYALVCLDKLLERPKGTGFVKYQTTESAQACIEAGKNKSIVLDGRQINAVLAMSKEYIVNKGQDAKKKGKDKRNLYLAREGTIRMGTSAAQNVSKSDMDKRSQLNRLKRQLLSNLHMVVSPVRLCINNLPLSLDDNGLEKLIKKYGPKAARITEARVMKDLKSVDSKGKRLSKGYGFVSFVRHEDALETLRRINNNPEVFSINKRPIVEFSVENMKALRARERRLERSKEVLEAKETGTPTGRKGKKRKIDLQHTPVSDKKEKDKDYVGALSDPKDKKLFTHIGPKNRHDKKKNRISRNSLKKNRRQKKQAIKSSDAQEPVAKKAKKEKEKKTPKKMIPDNSQFNSLVQSYKAKLSAVPNSSRQKWFET